MQGPLTNTRGHFWLMIWEQRSKAVIMLNRVIEKGSVCTVNPIYGYLLLMDDISFFLRINVITKPVLSQAKSFCFFCIWQEKCAQYWPSEEEKQMYFSDTGFVVTLVSEDVEPYYTTRVLELQNVRVGCACIGYCNVDLCRLICVFFFFYINIMLFLKFYALFLYFFSFNSMVNVEM